jgi:hypothetical protein
MNKAFIREDVDANQGHCPRCGSLGLAVPPAAVRAQLGTEPGRGLSEAGYFCPFARCEVAYFDLFGGVVLAESLPRPIYPKDPRAPICPCFGLSLDDIEADVREGAPRRVRQLLADSRSSRARCAELSPTGQSCVGEVQRLYLRLRAEQQGQ